ncbi:DEAD/DEAH box helicase [Massilia sp. Root418]|uniref:DEAD/DEAH box helicase family protein n=1 Tax=Massilia sp. Root418 TaxID=1736532 RepID=UPI000700294C|nr:DEAD/DEAH box helicase family protein [Massilia sp. Root418]KQW98767.1 DEAD/DEAH box helicase [Massilia sp. Root418]
MNATKADQVSMQDIKSLNFEPLRSVYPELANMGGYAEHYVHTDPESALVKLRSFAERLVDRLYIKVNLERMPQSNFADLLHNASFQTIAQPLVLDKLHLLRRLGNRAAHGEDVEASDAVRCVQEAWQLARWLHVTFLGGKVEDFEAFKQPPAEGIDSKAEFKRKAKVLAEENSLKEERLKIALQELAELRAADRATAPAVAAFAPSSAQALAQAAQSSAATANQLRFTEDNTRKWLINRDLRMAGWDVPKGTASNHSVGQEVEVLHQSTTTGKGYCDYVLWDDNGKPLAVVEAKKTLVDARAGQEQAKQYADALEKHHGQRPMIFFTNGHDIWVWDDAGGYPPRAVYGFYSKDTLQYRVGFQRREKLDLLKDVRPDANIAGYLHQIESITRVAERFTQRHRRALVVQATGTGKTRVAISLAKLLISARWVKRVLFLCDRKELRKQAKNAFNDFVREPIYVIGQANDVGKMDARIYIGIYQGLINDYETFDVGFFDLIIADESHRSIYNLYGDLFKYFDALQVGLTATPVEMVSRSTCQLFGCDYKLPTANYPLEQAIVDRKLVPFRVVAHTTKFLRDGIKAAHMTDEQIAQLEDQGIDPNTLDFNAKEIDDAVFNKGTNRVILRNLMDNGIRDVDGQLPGKTILFARNIGHARLLAELFNEMYPQFAGRFCRVIHSKEPRAEELIDQFKEPNGELRIAVSVDMLDTGIDVPEVVNLVFAKPVKSKVKFWQMIGRGTRLCKDLFGPGFDKGEFLIFDHWDNFAFHDLNAEEVEPTVPKPLTQRRYEARIELAALALARSDIPAFDILALQIQQDAVALPDGSIAVRENWQALNQARDPELVHQFAPITRQLLTDTVAPLMSALDVRGQGDALRWDLLLAKAEAASIAEPGQPNAHREAILEWVGRLPPHLNPVRAKAKELQVLRTDAFWQAPSFAQIDAMRAALRDVMELADRPSLAPPMPIPHLDICEDEAEYQVYTRPSKIKSVDFSIYRKAVQSALEPLFETDPVLLKLRRGERITPEELDKLNSLLHTRNADVDLSTLREFYPDTAVQLTQILRGIVGLDHTAVDVQFSAFAQAHALNSQQLRFLALLKDHIRQFGAIAVGQLFDAPFNTVHAEGLGGVFPNPMQLDEVVRLVRTFGEPLPPAAL